MLIYASPIFTFNSCKFFKGAINNFLGKRFDRVDQSTPLQIKYLLLVNFALNLFDRLIITNILIYFSICVLQNNGGLIEFSKYSIILCNIKWCSLTACFDLKTTVWVTRPLSAGIIFFLNVEVWRFLIEVLLYLFHIYFNFELK